MPFLSFQHYLCYTSTVMVLSTTNDSRDRNYSVLTIHRLLGIRYGPTHVDWVSIALRPASLFPRVQTFLFNVAYDCIGLLDGRQEASCSRTEVFARAVQAQMSMTTPRTLIYPGSMQMYRAWSNRRPNGNGSGWTSSTCAARGAATKLQPPIQAVNNLIGKDKQTADNWNIS